MPFNYSNSDVHRKEDYYVKATLFEFLSTVNWRIKPVIQIHKFHTLLLYHLDRFYCDLRQAVPVLAQPVWNTARIGQRRSTTTTTLLLLLPLLQLQVQSSSSGSRSC